MDSHVLVIGKMGFSFVTLCIIIILISIILGIHWAIFGMHHNQCNPDFDPYWVILPSLLTCGSLIYTVMLVPLLYMDILSTLLIMSEYL